MEELLQKIILKAHEINQNTKHTVFYSFSGHVNWFEIMISLKGWEQDNEFDIMLTAKLNEKTATEELKDMLKKLEELEEK